MQTKTVVFKIFVCLAVMVPTAGADFRPPYTRCDRRSFEEDGVARDVKWNLDAEEAVYVQFFFLSHTRWNGAEDLLNIQMTYASRNGSWKQTNLLFVPPVPHGQFSLPPPSLNASLITLPDLRFGWNQINLTVVEDPFDYRVLYVNNVTTGVDINPRGSVTLTVNGVDPFINCIPTRGYRDYYFPSSALPTSRVFAFFWNETRNVTLEPERGQRISLPYLPEGLIVTTLPGGKRLIWCKPENVSWNEEQQLFHLMRECPPGWRETPKGYGKVVYFFFASVEDLKEDEDVFVAKKCGFVQLNVTWTGEERLYLFNTFDQWPVDLFYDDVFPLEEECPPYPMALLCVDIALGIFLFGLIVSIVWYSWRLWRQKKKNKKLAEEHERLKKEYTRRFAQWYINAYPGEIKKLIDERRERKRQIARARPSLLVAEEVAYDHPSVSTAKTDSTRGLQRLESDPYETLPEVSPTLVSGPGKGSGLSVLVDPQAEKVAFTKDATDATGSCPPKH